MPTPKERLCHLLELAAKGPEQRAALAGEVADMLLDWPSQYPLAMRATFEALLEKIAREMDCAARTELAARFEGRSDSRLALLNELFLAAPAEMKDAILLRNDAQAVMPAVEVDEETLLAAARARENFPAALASLTGIPRSIATEIVADKSGRALAVVCRAANVNRATFSAIVILAGPVRAVHDNFSLLSVYDKVPANGAVHLLAFWRGRSENAVRTESFVAA
jgi:hypothetical protein